MCCFFVLDNLSGQETLLENRLSLLYGSERHEGALRYLLFHRYDPAKLNVSPHQHHLYDPFTDSVEFYRSLGIHALYGLNKQYWVELDVGMRDNRRMIADTLVVRERALADPVLQLKYVAYDSRIFQQESNAYHLAIIGGGVHLPLGEYEGFSEASELEPHFQAGVGSWTYRAYLGYEYMGRIGVQWESSYLYYTKNKYRYRFGNQLESQLRLSYPVALKNGLNIKPFAEAQYVYVESDELDGKLLMDELKSGEDTGGQLLWASLGASLRFLDVFSLKGQYAVPVMNNLLGQQLERKNQIKISINYYFK